MRTVACIVQEGFSPFEFGIACEVFGTDRSDDGIPPFDFRVLAPVTGRIRSSLGFAIEVTDGLERAADADALVFPPLPRAAWDAPDEQVLAAVRAAHERGAWLLSLCSGAFTLAASGVLDGRRATTHWRYAEELAGRHPRVDVDPDVLYVQDGRIITSAGTAAGIDAGLHLLRQELGPEAVSTIARRMVVAPQRDGGQAQFIQSPLPPARGRSLAPLADWVLEHLDEPLDVERLAARAHLSPRTFARRFKADYGTTPAAWLGRQRVLRAQQLLERTELGIEAVAAACGFGSAAVLRQNSQRALGTTPTAYRARFACPVPA